MKTNELKESITKKIIEHLENNKVPCWRKPWVNDPNCGFPTSVSTKNSYRGINILLLQLASMTHEFNGKWWGTFNQWKKMGGSVMPRPSHVKQGQWGTNIVLYKPFEVKEVKENEEGEEEESSSKRLYMKTFTVFNIDQVRGEKLDHLRPNIDDNSEIKHFADYEKAEHVVESTGADIRYVGNRAFYKSPTPYEAWPKHTDGDYIKMPPRSHYPSIEAFYSTRFHELIHWAEVRVDWKRDRSEERYAEGELIAEMGACFLTAECGIPFDDDMKNHTDYLKIWLEKMKKDSSFIFRASTQASKSCDYILKLAEEKEKENDAKSQRIAS